MTDASTLAESILTQLGEDFTLPDVDLSGVNYQLPAKTGPFYAAVDSLNIADLTEGLVGGNGAFDKLMSSTKAHLQEQRERGLITGDQYTKAYIELTSTALGSALQFLLQKDQSYWQALLVQAQGRRAEIEAVTAAVQLESAKAQLAALHYQASTAKAQYVLTLMQVATEDAKYELTTEQIAQAQYTLTELMPVQKSLQAEQVTQAVYTTANLLPLQKRNQEADAEIKEYQVGSILPENLRGLTADANVKEYQLSDMLPVQKSLVQEQVEVQRAQTLDTRTDGLTVVEGSVGKQKDLYDQQITSYQRSDEQKLGKVFVDAWTVQKTVDEGLLAPDQFTNENINEVLVALRASHNMGS